jgi:hypothetical protein
LTRPFLQYPVNPAKQYASCFAVVAALGFSVHNEDAAGDIVFDTGQEDDSCANGFDIHIAVRGIADPEPFFSFAIHFFWLADT